MKVVVLQSNYIPWKGYFDLIHDADLFIFYDEVQYTKNDWRNRNRICTKNGPQWLTIPVPLSSVHQKISEVLLPAQGDWQKLHWKSLFYGYKAAPRFDQLEELMEPVLVGKTWEKLAEMNQHLTREICRRLKIETKIRDSSEYKLEEGRVDRLLSLLVQSRATTYISGPAAKAYLEADLSKFSERGIEVRWKEYSGYPVYPQLFEPFTHEVSILDMIANLPWVQIPEYIWGKARNP